MIENTAVNEDLKNAKIIVARIDPSQKRDITSVFVPASIAFISKELKRIQEMTAH